ncbi:MAG: response regulator transcription factor [bacterium]|nr:MAG: response regulator transcription factor [bacterium]
MRILIVEDEYSIARDIEWNCQQILGTKIESMQIIQTLEAATDFLLNNPIDLLLLDLNLGGKNGYELLRAAVAGSFHTIIISAHTEQAIEAFEYGVLDFLPKPFDEARLGKAFDRYFGRVARDGSSTKYLTVRKRHKHVILPIDEILYFKAANYYSEAVLNTGEVEILDKSLDRLVQILPSRFFRIHRSCIVDINYIESFTPVINGSSQLTLKNGEKLPLSKRRYKELRDRMNC